MKDVFSRNRIFRFFRSNGVYVALAVSLLAVCGVVAASFGQSISLEPAESEEERVEQTVTGQKDTRTTRQTQTTTVTTTEGSASREESPELYVFPLSNTVQMTFSVEMPIYSKTMGDWRLHTGVDFAGEEGQKVKAMARGTVLDVNEDSLWGNIVVIDHGVGVESRYYGVLSKVEEGEEVDVGAVIGTLTEVPCESAQSDHLHFEVYVDGKPVDPLSVINLEVRYSETME